MRQSIKVLFFALVFSFGVAAPLTVTMVASPVSAANCEPRLLGIPPWYRGLTVDGNDKNKTSNIDCSIKPIVGGTNGSGLGSFIWTVILNVIEMAIVIIAYIAVFFVIYGGFLFMTGGGNPSSIEKARKTLTNAIIGLVISMAAIGATNLIFSIIK